MTRIRYAARTPEQLANREVQATSVGAHRSITLAERRSTQRGEIESRVPAEWLLPLAHQRYDDLSPVGDE